MGDIDAKSLKLDTEANKRDIIVRANTAAIDCENEVVVPEGASLGYLEKNRKVFFEHRYNYPEDCIGAIRRGYPKLVDGEWMVRIGVSRCEAGDRLLRDAADFGIGVSIGFDALDYGPPTDDEIKRYGGGVPFRSIVRKWEWIELSVTAMPCNVECQSIAVDAGPVEEPVKARKRFILTPFAVVKIRG
jgi:hypothetical protein